MWKWPGCSSSLIAGSTARSHPRAGRLFDAVSALLGVCAEISYEAQAAVELEQVASGKWQMSSGYPFEIKGKQAQRVVRLSKMFLAILGDRDQVLVSEIAWRFHCTIARRLSRSASMLPSSRG